MNILLSFVVLAVFSANAFAKKSSPKIQVYSRNPGEFGKENTLICYVSEFHPPDIEIKLLKNDEEIPKANQSDLAFVQGWKFHLTKSVKFTPSSGEDYSCSVRHLDTKRKSAGSQTCKLHVLHSNLLQLSSITPYISTMHQ